MNTTFIINDGLGKLITSIPALEKYYKNNPDDDFKVLVNQGESIFYSNPILQNRVFNYNQKGTFVNHIKQNNTIIVEPYSHYSFYNEKCSLIEAFDKIINKTDYHDDLQRPSLYLTDQENEYCKQLIFNYKKNNGKDKVLIFQPFGSNLQLINGNIIDPSNRSLKYNTYIDIVREISKHAVILFASHTQFISPEDKWSVSFDDEGPYLRMLIGLINNSDYFVGIDSVGQHIAYSLDKPGLVIGGATNDISYSYPNHFKIYRKSNQTPVYMPWKIADVDCEFSSRDNSNILNFSNEQNLEIINLILEELNNV